MVSSGSTIALVSTRPGVLLFYRTGRKIKVFQKTVDGKAQIKPSPVGPLENPTISPKSNIAASRRSTGTDSLEARVFYQGTDDYLREFTIDDDGTYQESSVDPVRDEARVGTGLAAVAQNDDDKTPFQVAKSLTMPTVLFYQNVRNNLIYFVRSVEPGAWLDPIPVNTEAPGEPGTSIQAYIGMQYASDGTPKPMVYVSYVQKGSLPETFVRHQISVDDLSTGGAVPPAFAPDKPALDYGQRIQGRFASLCIPGTPPDTASALGNPDAFRFYAQLSSNKANVYEGAGARPSGAGFADPTTMDINDNVVFVGKEEAQVGAVFQPDPRVPRAFVLTVVWEKPTALVAKTFEGKWDKDIIVGSKHGNAGEDEPDGWAPPDELVVSAD